MWEKIKYLCSLLTGIFTVIYAFISPSPTPRTIEAVAVEVADSLHYLLMATKAKTKAMNALLILLSSPNTLVAAPPHEIARMIEEIAVVADSFSPEVTAEAFPIWKFLALNGLSTVVVLFVVYYYNDLSSFLRKKIYGEESLPLIYGEVKALEDTLTTYLTSKSVLIIAFSVFLNITFSVFLLYYVSNTFTKKNKKSSKTQKTP